MTRVKRIGPSGYTWRPMPDGWAVYLDGHRVALVYPTGQGNWRARMRDTGLTMGLQPSRDAAIRAVIDEIEG